DELQRAADAARLRGREEMAQALEGEIANIRSSLPEVTRLGRATDIAREAATTGAWAAGVGGLAYGLQPAESPSTEAASTAAEDAALVTTAGTLAVGGGPRFYSRLLRRIQSGPRVATAQQWRKHLQQGTAKVEREWTGVEDFLSNLDPNQKVTRDEIEEVFRRGEIRVGHTLYGGAADPRLDQLWAQVDELQAAKE